MHHLVEFNKKTTLIEKYKSNAYMLWVLSLYMDDSDTESLASRFLTDGSNDKCIDFIGIDKSGQKIIVAQGYFAKDTADKAPAKKASDLNTAAAWLAHGDIDAKTINPRLRACIQQCREAIETNDIDQIDLLYIHNLPTSINTQEEIDTCQKTSSTLFGSAEISITCKEIGLKEVEVLYLERASQILITDEIEIKGEKLGVHQTKDWDSFIYTVKGGWLRDIFKQHDDRLFSANYRGFLGAGRKGNINSAIKSTAERQPEDFWVFNNGITLLTNKVTEKRNGRKYLSGISIINGAQTTGSLGSVDLLVDLSDVFVMCRVVVCKNPGKVNDIVKYNNTQNKITTWDQYANDSMQGIIKLQFKELGIDYSIKRGFDAFDSPIGIEKSAQPILAFNGHYTDANRSRNSIFDRPETYKRAFSDKSATHILLAFCFSLSIDDVKKSLQDKDDRTENEEKQLSLFDHLSFKLFLLACIGVCLQQFVGKKFTPNEARFSKSEIVQDVSIMSQKLEKITRQVLRAVALEIEKRNRSLSVQ
jgi:AIPR protein